MFRHLRELQFSHCGCLADAEQELLAELRLLEVLHLNATPITDPGLYPLGD